MPHIFSSERPTQRRAAPAGVSPMPGNDALSTLQQQANDSPAQRRLGDLQQMATQRMEDEELMQGKARDGGLESPAQRTGEEELLQGKAEGGGLNAAPVHGGDTGDGGGLPGSLRSGIESLSGMDMSGVRVHYNSPEPAQLNAHAFAQGDDIHLATGQEQHLGHEAWHVVQQREGRVQPTTDVGGVAVNDSEALESEADRMGARALQTKPEDRA